MTDWQRRYENCDKQRKMAWVKYYAAVRGEHSTLSVQYTQLKAMVDTEGIPPHILTEITDMYEKLKIKVECPVCMELIPNDTLKISRCGHKYCNGCFDKLVETSNKCAMCRKQLTFKRQ